jgi:hypothetical protein
MREITLAVIGVRQANRGCFASFHVMLVSPPPLLLGSFTGKGQLPCCLQTRRLQRPLCRGLVLDCSLGAGVTDETFLIPLLDMQYLKCCVTDYSSDLSVSLEFIKQRVKAF